MCWLGHVCVKFLSYDLLVTLEGTRAQKLTTVFHENGDFCHPVLGFGLSVKKEKKKNLKNVPTPSSSVVQFYLKEEKRGNI